MLSYLVLGPVCLLFAFFFDSSMPSNMDALPFEELELCSGNTSTHFSSYK